jgi:hypothetical protein
MKATVFALVLAAVCIDLSAQCDERFSQVSKKFSGDLEDARALAQATMANDFHFMVATSLVESASDAIFVLNNAQDLAVLRDLITDPPNKKAAAAFVRARFDQLKKSLDSQIRDSQNTTANVQHAGLVALAGTLREHLRAAQGVLSDCRP